ncbi:MAG TPA: prolyl oligopeptidase family serine peptidase [Gemmatimonadaceae bacterium]|nr:prolyl oligopeptidase family serine peptidase [Gemmatimonadaceae bacterium]
MTDTYTDEFITLRAAGWRIPAALTLPASRAAGAPLPSAILLIPGSLFSDVNGDYPSWNSFPHTQAFLAKQLAARGHAVYRFAKLGPGTGSEMDDPDVAARNRSWDGRLAIATAALDAMRRELDARHVAVARTIAAGHSEGSVVVSRLAASDAGRALDGVVLLAGPSVGILDIMREQAPLMTPPEQREEAMRTLDIAIAHIRRGEAVPAGLATGPWGAGALASMPPEAQQYMRDVDATDPAALAATLPQPVLVVQGSADTSVPPHHAETLVAALRSRAGGASRTAYALVPEVSHMFKVVPPELSGPAAFGYPGETDPRVTDAIDHWIRELV